MNTMVDYWIAVVLASVLLAIWFWYDLKRFRKDNKVKRQQELAAAEAKKTSYSIDLFCGKELVYDFDIVYNLELDPESASVLRFTYDQAGKSKVIVVLADNQYAVIRARPE